jgi:hypothetical protein
MELGTTGAGDPQTDTPVESKKTHKTKTRLVAGRGRTFVALVALGCALAALFAFTGGADAMVRTGGTGSTPWISSDLPDYPPGATVNLLGQNWQPGESVHITVNDDQGQTWSWSDDVTADPSGDISDSLTLPNSFVATYAVTATGSAGETATTSFTDANAVPTPTRVPGSGSQSMTPGGSAFSFNITYTKSGGGNDPQIQTPLALTNTTSGGGTTCGVAGTIIPSSWVTVTSGLPATVTTSAVVGVRVSVPAGTSPGSYTATIKPDVVNGTGGAGTFDLCLTVPSTQATSLSAVSGAGAYGGTGSLTATLKAGTTGVSGKSVAFKLNGTAVGSATTDSAALRHLRASA